MFIPEIDREQSKGDKRQTLPGGLTIKDIHRGYKGQRGGFLEDRIQEERVQWRTHRDPAEDLLKGVDQLSGHLLHLAPCGAP